MLCCAAVEFGSRRRKQRSALFAAVERWDEVRGRQSNVQLRAAAMRANDVERSRKRR